MSGFIRAVVATATLVPGGFAAAESGASAKVAATQAGAHAVATADVERGRKVFAQYCAICHGPTGGADGPAGRGLAPPPRNFQIGDFRYGGTDRDIFEVISNGAASKGGSPLMVSWAELIPEEDRWALVKFVRTLKRPPQDPE